MIGPNGVEGFMYPNEVELQWSILIVLYPFITGLVAGAFILASLERVFKVSAVKPTYRLALLTALAFLLVAPLPLQLHLGHPERSFEMYLTPHTSSAMVTGIAAVMLIYMATSKLRKIAIDMRCLDTICQYLFYVFVIDFSLEMLDLIHRIYEADESFRSLDFMVHTRLWASQVIIQILAGTVVPLVLLGMNQIFHFREGVRKAMYAVAG